MIEADVIRSSHKQLETYRAEFADNDKDLILWVQAPWGLE